ncbi:DUF3800 domain-containing protein [Dyella sp. GSA-30]|jgi:hypothetical protein|uniref:DUF3800 domain-containing protein n=1 Tax=Dyella sp. GSA-30 TaxID=2994496 RepID=UPI0024910021|nr:DUF3800 domain-containing protein [Dyella sp. GSA-30]
MHIYLDESGSFGAATHLGSWCVVAAYVVPEAAIDGMSFTLREYKRMAGFPPTSEVKRRHAPIAAYLRLLNNLASNDGFLVAVATDAGANGDVLANQRLQVHEIRSAIGLHTEAERCAASDLAYAVERLSPQLYVELICRLLLIWRVIKLSTLRFGLSYPEALHAFRWRFDAKNTQITQFEQAFGPTFIGLALNMSRKDPLLLLPGGDRSWLDRYRRTPPDPLPAHAADAVWLDPTTLITDDLQFVDSRESEGVQVADLLASGIGSCLRQRSATPRRQGRLLGRLMLRLDDIDDAVVLVGFDSSQKTSISTETLSALHRMKLASHALLRHR